MKHAFKLTHTTDKGSCMLIYTVICQSYQDIRNGVSATMLPYAEVGYRELTLTQHHVCYKRGYSMSCVG